MPDQEIIIYGAILLTVAFALLLMALVILHLRLNRKYQAVLERKTVDTKKPQADLDKILSDAQKQGQKIISDANVRAQQIVGEAGTLSNESKQKMLSQLDAVARQYEANYQEIIKTAKTQTGELIAALGADIKKEAHLEVEAMREALRAEIAKAQAATKAAVEETYKRVEEEIKGYKTKRLSQVDTEIFEIISLVSEEVLGKAISTKEHEDLILKSLEDAKKQNVF